MRIAFVALALNILAGVLGVTADDVARAHADAVAVPFDYSQEFPTPLDMDDDPEMTDTASPTQCNTILL